MRCSAMTQGVHHVGLTVPNLAKAFAFFTDVLGFRKVGDKPGYPAMFVSDGVTTITIWQAKDPASAIPFDRKNNIGLHHLAIRVADAATLDALHEKLKTNEDVAVEFCPEPLGTGPTMHMMCFVPGGIRMEFIAPGR